MVGTFLDTMYEYKVEEVMQRKQQKSLIDLKQEVVDYSVEGRDFVASLQASAQQPAIIAEFKMASPSMGAIAPQANLAAVVKSYAANGAAAISVLTDEDFFQGSLTNLTEAKSHTTLPILRKDFIVDEYQVYESAVAGADALLLITSMLSAEKLSTLARLARELDMQILIEVHAIEEIERAVQAHPDMLGINNRNLHTMDVNLQTFADLIKHVPDDMIVIAESGIYTADDLTFVKKAGAHAALIGTSLMKATDPGKQLAELCR